MKSTVSNQPCTKETPFPKLMVNHYGTIVLFSSPRTGMCIRQGNTEKTGAFYHDCWDDNAFKDYNGSVCLEND